MADIKTYNPETDQKHEEDIKTLHKQELTTAAPNGSARHSEKNEKNDKHDVDKPKRRLLGPIGTIVAIGSVVMMFVSIVSSILTVIAVFKTAKKVAGLPGALVSSATHGLFHGNNNPSGQVVETSAK